MFVQSIQKYWREAVLVALVCFVAACEPKTPYTQQQTTTVQPTLSSIQANIFNLKCGVAGCHVTGGIAPMSLQTGASYAALVNVQTGNAAYGGLLRVKPNDALNSILYLKVIGDTKVGGTQGRMPAGLGAMTAGEISAIQTWINNGAQNN